MQAPRSDVVVIGGGLAGIVATLELLSAGRRVTLIDRDVEANFGGLARESFGGILFVDTPEQRRARVRDTPDLALRDWLTFGEFGRDPEAEHWPRRWAEAYVNECRADVYEWLKAHGIRFLPMPLWVERGQFGGGNSVPRWHITWGTGQRLATRLIEALATHPRRAALTLRFGHRVDALVVEGGRVAGCRGVVEASAAGFVAPGDAVLVATGGINGSIERVRRHWHADWGAPPPTILNGSHRFADGRLHDAVEAIGGRVANLDRMWNYAAGVHHWRPRKPGHGLSLVPPRSALWLDRHGARLGPPPLVSGFDTRELVGAVCRAPGQYSWQLMNRRIALKELAISGAEFNPSIRERSAAGFVRDLLFGNRWLLDEMTAHCEDVEPVLVTHEGGAAFMADGVSRAADDTIGVLVIVPAAGLTHAASGIGEAFLDGIPMLVVTGGVRTDTGNRYRLHEIDQLALAAPITKAAFRVMRHEDVVATIFEAHRIATSGLPGPVLVEIPVNLQLFAGEAGDLPRRPSAAAPLAPDPQAVARAGELLAGARKPVMLVGWGARGAIAELEAIAELLQAPVATTLQGLAAFPGEHPLHVGFGFSPSAVPAARNAFADGDAMLAVGTRFGEIPTGSFSAEVPAALVHVDIDPAVFDANYPSRVAIAGDAKLVLGALLADLRARGGRATDAALRARIVADKRAYRAQWYAHDSRGRVNPARFFDGLRARMPDDAITVLDDGNHTFLTAELFELRRGARLLTPTDFNAMGYAVPAAIGAKLARPEREVFAIVGDGCFMMTCMEIVTAAARGVGVVCFVFNDGELSQIAQAQQIPYNRTPCTTVGGLDVAGVAQATGAAYVAMPDDAAIGAAIDAARTHARQGRPVIVDVRIDYSKRTAFTSGTAKSTFRRFPLSQRLRIAGRALARRVTG